MSTEDEYALLAENFSRSGYLIERRLIGGVDSIVVVGKPDRVNGITLYKRSIQLHQDAECQWHTVCASVRSLCERPAMPSNKPFQPIAREDPRSG
jgi:hypothetical protein